MKQLSLKTRVTLFTLAVFLVGIWSLTYLVSRIQREDMTEVLGQEQYSTVSILAGVIDSEVSTLFKVTQNTAVRITPKLMADPQALANFLLDRPILLTLFNAGVFVTDAQGVAIASLPEDTKRLGQSFLDRDFIAGALRDGKPVLGKPVSGRLKRGAIIGLAAPIRDAKGNVIGALAGVTNLNEPNFLDRIANSHYGRTGGYVLTSPADQLVITATDKSRIMTRLPDTPQDRLTQQFRDGIEGYGVGPDPRGEERIAAAKGIPSAKWQLVSSLPTEEGFAPIRDMERRMQLLALALSVLAGALTWWWLRLQFLPLTQATRSLRDMALQGGDAQPLPVRRDDEIGRLIVGFNNLLAVVGLQKKALAQERQRLENILAGTGAGTWELDLSTGQAELNERWAGIIGYTLDELRPINQATWSGHCHPDDYPQVQATLGRHLAGEGGGEGYDTTFRMRHKAGHWVWVRTLARITERGADGRALRVSGINLDVTRQKSAEEAIERASALLQAVLDSASGVAIIAIGNDQLITLFNKGAENLLGYRAEEIVGRERPRLLIDPQQARERLAATGGNPSAEMLGRKTEWTLVHKDGRPLEVALWLTPLVDAHGQRVGYLGVGYEISQEKRYERSLIEARDQAEAATRAKGQFVSNMSHEIRTPMNAILGLLQLLQSTELDPRQRDYVTKTHGAAKSLLGLINDVLDVSKMDAGKMELELAPFRLDTMLRDLSAILSTGVSDKPVEVLFDVAPDTPRALVGDAMRLKQVLINLGGNAIKFTLEGSVVLQIRVVARGAQGTTLRFAVTDTGIGIPAEQQERIFEGFSQAEASTTRRFGGTGLGLSISRELVRLMGGRLRLHSVVGQGSRFEFEVTLPHADADAPALGALPVRLPLAPQRVLVVDDNALAREILTTTVRSWGWVVEAVASGADAIDAVSSRAALGLPLPEVLLVDWFMPGMDGWEALERLQALFPADSQPLSIMVTAHDKDMLDRRKAHEQARLDGYLVKPLTASMLHDALADAQAARTQAPVPRVEAPQGQPLAGLRLLLVEDNLINQQVALELLTARGARVDVAGNGQLGLEALAAAPGAYDAVLMDLQMPVMDGFTATRRIREMPALAGLPVIAMTANAMATDRQACLDAGMDDHVGKPFDLPHLTQVLLQHIAGRQGRAAMPARPVAGVAGPADLDVAGALARMEGRVALYARILADFLAQAREVPPHLMSLLAAGDRAGAVRLLHTLKGLAATVGAQAVAGLARDAESLASTPDAGATALEAMAARLGDAIAAADRAGRDAIDALAAQAPQPPQPPAPAPAAGGTSDSAGEARATLAQLRELLASGDAGALEVHARLGGLLGGRAQAELAALDAAIAAFDFAGAEARCQALEQSLALEPAA